MSRTKKRALVTSKVSIAAALNYTLALSFLGFFLLSRTSKLVEVLGASAMFSYIVLYGYFKRATKYGTLVGTVPGAASLVAGYALVSGRLDISALLLFLVMMTWQLAHFYSIAIFRLKDYQRAGLPVWPAIEGVQKTKQQIILFISLFILANIALSLWGASGIVYAAVMSLAGLYWLRPALSGLSRANEPQWARRLFFNSLKVMTLFILTLSLASVLP